MTPQHAFFTRFPRHGKGEMDSVIGKPFEDSEHAKEPPDKQSLLDRINAYLNGGTEEALSAEVLRLFQDLNAYLRDASSKADDGMHTPPSLHATLKTMQASLDRIEDQGKATGNTRSYAAVAARNCNFGGANGQTMPDDTLKEKRKAKEITIRVEDPKEAEELKKKSSKDILLTAQAAGVEVTGVRRLPSGDVRFHTRSQNTRDILQDDAGWTKVVAALAKVQRQTYMIRAHGVQVKNVNTADQNKAIMEIKKANERLHQDLNIVRVSWPMRAIKMGKT